MEYDKLAPPPAGQRLRVINLRRRPNESLGFAVRGGTYIFLLYALFIKMNNHHPHLRLLP